MKVSKLIFTILCASAMLAGCNTVNNDEPDKDGTVTDADGEAHVLTPGDILVHFWKTK